jgi:hypothetical protein
MPDQQHNVRFCFTTCERAPEDPDEQTPYPLIDSDPHFSRVVKYFRPSDYATWAAGTLAFPGLLYGYGSLPYA